MFYFAIIILILVIFKNNCLKNALFSGASLGLAQGSKYTALLLYPLFLGFIIYKSFCIDKREKASLFINFLYIFIFSLIVLWALYGFDLSPILKNAMRPDEKALMIKNMAQKICPCWNNGLMNYLLFNLPNPFGAHILGILGIIRHSSEGNGTFFWGNWLANGSYLYFLGSFFIKTPIPMIIFIFTGLMVMLKNKITKSELYILISAGLFFITASFSKLQLGLRYILPIYPLLFIVASRTTQLFKQRYFKIMCIVLIVWLIISSVFTWPNYLSYFNEFIGGSNNGYKYLRDSNIDWGQDLPALAKYIKKNKIEEVAFLYFGQDKPEVYGINYKPISPEELKTPGKKVYAISAQYLEAVEWTKTTLPTAKAGYSIFIYDFRK